MVIDIFASAKKKEPLSQKELVDKLYEFYKKYILYAYSDYFQYQFQINSNEEDKDIKLKTQILKLTKIMLEMRTDLGLENKKLGNNGEKIFRALLSDYNKYCRN